MPLGATRYGGAAALKVSAKDLRRQTACLLGDVLLLPTTLGGTA